MYIAALIPLILSLVGVSWCQPTGCDPGVLDACGQNIVFIGVQGLKIPSTKEDLNQFCAKEQEADACAKNYINTCLKSLQKQLATMVIDSATKEVQSWCSEERIDEVTEIISCLSGIQSALDTCMRDMVNYMDAVANSGDEDNMIPHACCEFDNLRNCLVEHSGACPENAREFLQEAVQAYASDALDLACAGYETGSDKCSELPEVPRGLNSSAITIFKPLVTLIKAL